MRETQDERPKARTRRELESNLPKGWTIEPVSVEVKENDTLVEDPVEVFKALVELSWIEKSVPEVLKELDIKKRKDEDWNERRFREDCLMNEEYMPFHFLMRYYNNKYAFIKQGERTIYWYVAVTNAKFKMKTSKGILTMPCVSIQDDRGNKTYAFFPMKALLASQEQWLVNVYNNSYSSVRERDEVEKQILSLIAKLPTCVEPKSVLETNEIWEKIEEVCKENGDVKRVNVGNWSLTIEFDWRYVSDTDWEYGLKVLPPFAIKIDLRSFNITGQAKKHPHCLNDGSLCLWDELTQLAQDCIRDKSLLTLVNGMLKFANCWTSGDADNTDREPAQCIKRRAEDYAWTTDMWENLPVKKEDIIDTLRMRYGWENITSNNEFNRFLFSN